MTIVSPPPPPPPRELACRCTLNEFMSPNGSEFRLTLFHGEMFSYQASLLSNLNHSIRMSDGQVMSKLQSWSLKNRTEKLLEHSSTLNAFLSPKWVGIWIDLLQSTMFSYHSSLLSNLNHSIRISDGPSYAQKYSHGVIKT